MHNRYRPRLNIADSNNTLATDADIAAKLAQIPLIAPTSGDDALLAPDKTQKISDTDGATASGVNTDTAVSRANNQQSEEAEYDCLKDILQIPCVDDIAGNDINWDVMTADCDLPHDTDGIPAIADGNGSKKSMQQWAQNNKQEIADISDVTDEQLLNIPLNCGTMLDEEGFAIEQVGMEPEHNQQDIDEPSAYNNPLEGDCIAAPDTAVPNTAIEASPAADKPHEAIMLHDFMELVHNMINAAASKAICLEQTTGYIYGPILCTYKRKSINDKLARNDIYYDTIIDLETTDTITLEIREGQRNQLKHNATYKIWVIPKLMARKAAKCNFFVNMIFSKAEAVTVADTASLITGNAIADIREPLNQTLINRAASASRKAKLSEQIKAIYAIRKQGEQADPIPVYIICGEASIISEDITNNIAPDAMPYYKLIEKRTALTPNNIIETIDNTYKEYINKYKSSEVFPVLAVSRGGGDNNYILSQFGGVPLALKIGSVNWALTISGVGHHVDVSMFDSSCDISVSTPTAIANELSKIVDDAIRSITDAEAAQNSANKAMELEAAKVASIKEAKANAENALKAAKESYEAERNALKARMKDLEKSNEALKQNEKAAHENALQVAKIQGELKTAHEKYEAEKAALQTKLQEIEKQNEEYKKNEKAVTDNTLQITKMQGELQCKNSEISSKNDKLESYKAQLEQMSKEKAKLTVIRNVSIAAAVLAVLLALVLN